MVDSPGTAQGVDPTLESALAAVTTLHRAGRLEEARAACLDLVARHPGESEPHFREGLLEAELGSLASARDAIGRALALRDRPNYHYALGDVQERLGDRTGAIESWRLAVAAQPALAPAHLRLGVALQESGELAQAIAHFVLAVQSRPTDARAWNNLAVALIAQGNLPEAEVAARRAVSIAPDVANANVSLGRAILAQRRPAEAIVVLERAVALDSRHAHAWDLLGMAHAQAGALLAAKEAFLRSLQITPGAAAPWVRLAGACTHLGLHGEAIEAYRRAEALAPANAAEIGSALLFALQYDGTHDSTEVYAAHRAWAARHVPPRSRPAFRNSREPERRLRIGYVSPRFHQSSAAFVHAPVIALGDRNAFEVHCYAQQDVEDAVTDRIRASGARWIDTRNLGDGELAARLRDDGIDIAIDLAGHTPGNRLPMFAHGPAPVTGTWLDYFNTTGMDGIDFLVTDSVHSPPGDGQEFTERLVRLPRCRLCWEPPAYAPAVEPLPLARGAAGPVFGSFNRVAKLSPATLDAWCALLRRVPGSRLVLKNPTPRTVAEDAFFAEWFRDRGVEPARIEWRGASAHEAALAEYAGIDVVLDTFPYNGGITTLEALWMGRPVVTVGGDTLISRQSKGILSAAGLPELCAPDAAGFVDIAAGLVAEPARLAALSATLRARLQASALLDHAGFVRDFVGLLRAEWRRWCASTE